MKDSDFVELVARLETSAEEGATEEEQAAAQVLDGLIEAARDTVAQALAPEGLTAAQLFDDLGEKIMSLEKGARVLARCLSVGIAGAPVIRIEFRDNIVWLDIEDQIQEAE